MDGYFRNKNILIYGSSFSGKTTLLYRMILSNKFGKKDKKIVVLCNSHASLNQPAYKKLKRNGYNINHQTFDNIRNVEEDSLIVIEDFDSVTSPKIKNQIVDIFSTESHHKNYTVVLITHSINFGAPAVWSSTDAIIICNSNLEARKKIYIKLCLTDNQITKCEEYLCLCKDFVKINGLHYTFNNCLVFNREFYDEKKQKVEKIARLSNRPYSVDIIY